MNGMMPQLMAGKRGLVMGLANDRSLAWGIAKQLSDAGADLAFSYQGETMEKRVRPLAEQLGVARLFDCDVADMAELDRCFEALAGEWPTIDFVVHAIGFSDKNELRGRFMDTSLDNFLTTMNVSVYSFVAVAQRAAKLMPHGGALLTLSYYGAEKVIPHYNVMGVAKAALETASSTSTTSTPTSSTGSTTSSRTAATSPAPSPPTSCPASPAPGPRPDRR